MRDYFRLDPGACVIWNAPEFFSAEGERHRAYPSYGLGNGKTEPGGPHGKHLSRSTKRENRRLAG